MTPVSITRGDGPIILGQPHGGTWVPDDLLGRLNDTGRALADTDWHINRLYDGLIDNATVVQSHVHRYVVDANRDPEGTSLYPGQNTTGLCPLTNFDGSAIWREGQEPSPDEIADRTARYHAPYHAALGEEIRRIQSLHGFAVVYDCHSIRSRIPFLFPGELPTFSIGTNDGLSCAAGIGAITETICRAAEGYDTAVNGRFKGGWTTRHYGRPSEGVHAIQMELAQCSYMEEVPPWRYRAETADHLRAVLSEILKTIRDRSDRTAVNAEGVAHD